MIFLSGVSCPEAEALGRSHGVGLMVTPLTYGPLKPPLYPCHALDNGAFAHPITAGSANEARWLRWLDRMPRERCLFAVMPDIAYHEGNRAADPAAGTLALFEHYHERVRAMGFPVAFALQNGQEALPVPWDECDALFIGGDTAWKLSHHALYLTLEAKNRGLWVHMGRANSLRRFRRAAEMQVDSADGNFLRWPKANGPRLVAMLDSLARTSGQLACA